MPSREQPPFVSETSRSCGTYADNTKVHLSQSRARLYLHVRRRVAPTVFAPIRASHCHPTLHIFRGVQRRLLLSVKAPGTSRFRSLVVFNTKTGTNLHAAFYLRDRHDSYHD